jgi:hypothetical protein
MTDPRRGVPISGTPAGQRVVQAALAIAREQSSDLSEKAVDVQEVVERTGLEAEFVQRVLDHVFGLEQPHNQEKV